MDSIDMLTTDELAKKLRITTVTLRRWVKAGQFPAPVRIGENSVRWRESTISKWLDQQTSSENPENAALDIEQDELAESLKIAKHKKATL